MTALLAGVPGARAAAQTAGPWPGLTLSFVEPAGAVSPTESIDVRLRLALAPGAAAVAFDAAAGGPDFGLPAGTLPDAGRVPGAAAPQPFARYTRVRVAPVFGCLATFGGPVARDGLPANCRAAAYRFVFADPQATAEPTFVSRTDFALRPGETFDFLFGTFVADAGPAPAGTYRFNDARVDITLDGLDALNRPVSARYVLATTCATPAAPDPTCQTFTRTVLGVAVVPEPGSAALVGAGVLALGAVRARRRAEGATPRRHGA